MSSDNLGIGGLNISKDEITSHAFDLFSPVNIDTSIIDSTVITVRPINSTDSGGPFEFVIPADEKKWTACETLRLSGRVKLVKITTAAGVDTESNLGAKDDISTCNNFYHSLFRNVSVKLNGTELSDPTGKWYPYKAYLETLLSYGHDTKEGRLAANGWYKDVAGTFNTFPIIDATTNNITSDTANEGYKSRRSKFALSAWAYFTINLHTDLTTLTRNLPPGIKLEINLERTDDAFTILSGSAPNKSIGIKIEDLEMKVRRYTPNDKIQNHYFTTLAKRGFASIPIDRSLIKVSTVKSGTSDLSVLNVIRGAALPDQILAVMIEETAYNGVYNKNPFMFSDNGFVEASLVVNGIHEPKNLYRAEVSTGNYYQLYSDFLENTGISLEDRDLWIKPDDYVGGCFILAFDRNFDKCNRYHRHVPSSGIIDLNLRVKTPIDHTMSVLLYATYSSDLVIDKDYRVSVERF